MPRDWKMASNIGERLYDVRWRVFHKMTQPEFGDVVFRSVSTLSSWENGHGRPDPLFLRQLAKRIGAPLRVFEEDGPLPSSIVNGPVNALGVTNSNRLARSLGKMKDASETITEVSDSISEILRYAVSPAAIRDLHK